MDRRRTGPAITPDLFSSAAPQERPSRPPNSAASSRTILPSDLPTAIKHLSDQELEQLVVAVAVERQRRGTKPTAVEKAANKQVERPTLTVGKLNAVRAAFKAGVTPARIAKQFGIPQAEVRKALGSDRPKP